MPTEIKFNKNSDKFQLQHSCVWGCKTHITDKVTGISPHTQSV